MRYRPSITLLAATAVWSLAAHAQQSATPGNPKEPSSDPAFAKAVAAVTGKLKDPQSIRYGEMVRKFGPNVNGKSEEVVCGSVNEKEGYGGRRPFVYFTGDGATFLVDKNPQPEDVAQIIYQRFCK
jgi:hypothetical protein